MSIFIWLASGAIALVTGLLAAAGIYTESHHAPDQS